MKVHLLKTEEKYWTDVGCYGKEFELRKDDRGFESNDTVVLFKGQSIDLAERVIVKRIGYILRGPDAERFGLKAGYCIFGLYTA